MNFLAAAFCRLAASRLFSKLKPTERADEENTPTGKHFLKICIFSGLPLLILPFAIHGGLKNSASNLQTSQMDIKLIFRDFLLRCDDGIDIDFVIDMDFLRLARNRFSAADNKMVE